MSGIQEQQHENQTIFKQENYQEIYEEEILYKQKKMQIDQKQIGHFSNNTLLLQNQNPDGIKISIKGIDIKGGTIRAITYYCIKGEDKNGIIDVKRRFNQFHQTRSAMVKRWPACFIPSIPSKNYFKKNDDEIVKKRQRYLNDYLKKIARLPHLYQSEEFQTLIRSKQIDISNSISHWPNPTIDSIINKYRQFFSELAGKQINAETEKKIGSFASFIMKNSQNLELYEQRARKLGESRDNLDALITTIFKDVFIPYEKLCLLQYCGCDENKLLYGNSQNAKLAQHENIAKQSTKKNPYWLLYDLIQQEQRDGKAFLQALQTRNSYQIKKKDIQIKINQNLKIIDDINTGKKNMKSLTSKGSNEELKYKLEVDNEELNKLKDSILILCDIMTALLVYIEIQKYKQSKQQFYQNVLLKIGGYEINQIQNFGEIWMQVNNKNQHLLQIYEN